MSLLTPARPHCSLPSLLNTTTQIRHASLLRRPKRPYTFTQLITLSDGSTFTHRTTSPAPIYRSTKDTKNNPLWNPSSQKLLNVEEDEAGRLRRFRKRFGRGFDAVAFAQEVEAVEGADPNAIPEEQEESLEDLISGYAQSAEAEKKQGKKGAAAAGTGAAGVKEPAVKSGKGKGGQK